MNHTDLIKLTLLHPRQGFRHIQKEKIIGYITPLLMLSGIFSALENASENGLGDHQSLFSLMFWQITIGAVVGLIFGHIFAHIISYTGKWFHGKANSKEIVRVIAYSSIPTIISGLLFLPLILVFGEHIFHSFIPEAQYSLLPIYLLKVHAFLAFVLGIWSFILLVVGLSEIQQYSIGSALLNVFAPIFIIALLVFACVILWGVLSI